MSGPIVAYTVGSMWYCVVHGQTEEMQEQGAEPVTIDNLLAPYEYHCETCRHDIRTRVPSLCKCGGEPNRDCPVIGHPLFLVDRTARSLVLHIAERLGEGMRNERSQIPVFFQDVETGRFFQIDAVIRETSETGDTIFLKGEQH